MWKTSPVCGWLQSNSSTVAVAPSGVLMHWPTNIAKADVSVPVASGEEFSEERDEEGSEERSDEGRPPKGRPEQADRPRARIAAVAPRASVGRIA